MDDAGFLEKLVVPQLAKKIPPFYGILWFVSLT